MKPYRVPDPFKQPVESLVLAFKTRKGVEFDNRDWDKVNWGRSMVSAKAIMSVCKDLRTSDECLMDLGQQWDESGINWGIEAIARNAADWMQKRRHGAGSVETRQRLFTAMAEARKQKEGGAVPDVEITDGFEFLQLGPGKE